MKTETIETEIATIEIVEPSETEINFNLLNNELKSEISKLETEIKMKRKLKTQKALLQLAILVLTFIVCSEYFENTWYMALLKSIGMLFLIGFILLTIQFLKYVRTNR